jgi:cytochrome c oxidase subunit 4
VEPKPVVSYAKYVMIWLALLVLTGATVTVAGMRLGSWSALAAILIATVKGTLVLFYFMHLKYEAWIFKISLMIALLTMTIILVLTFTDTALR